DDQQVPAAVAGRDQADGVRARPGDPGAAQADDMVRDEDAAGQGGPDGAVDGGVGDAGPVEGQRLEKFGQFDQQIGGVRPPGAVDAPHDGAGRGDGQPGHGRGFG